MKAAPRVTRYELHAPVEKPLSFVFVSDLHECDNAPVLAALNGLPADALLVGGDFLHTGVGYERGVSFLTEAAKKMPVFVSVGNHERKSGLDIASLVGKTGAVLLDDGFLSFGGITLGGLSSGFPTGDKQGHFKKTPPPDTAFAARFAAVPGYKLLLCHHPEYYPAYLRDLPVDLILSGHAHGGQWRFFGRGLFAPGQGIFPKYTAGTYERRLIVSRGLGNPHPIPRIFNPPEIVSIRIEPRSSSLANGDPQR